jgi:menaquinone-dependent protoporphyrinogen oxidase
MRPVLVLYSSSEGQTRKFAARVIEHLTVHGREARVDDVENPIEAMNAASYRAAVLVASVHLGQPASQTMWFVRRHREELARLPAAFLAVSLAAASAEDERQDHSRHARSSADVKNAIDDFLERTRFAPTRILPVGGTLLYKRSGQFARFVMQHIDPDTGLVPDGDRDLECTANDRVDRFIDEFLSLRPALPARKAARAHG